jgi:tRNA (cytidine/uridine-2'-O-)-methyltransferase
LRADLLCPSFNDKIKGLNPINFSDLPRETVDNNHPSPKSTAEQGGAKPTPPPWLHVALFQPEIPQNTGNIGRTCVALGAKLWLIRPLGFRLDEKQLRRAGMDYWQHLQWEAVDHWEEFTLRMAGKKIWIVTKFGKITYHQCDFQPGDCVLFGSESAGLPPSIHAQHGEQAISIPMRPEARSLNLSNAVSIVTYDLLRRFPN